MTALAARPGAAALRSRAASVRAGIGMGIGIGMGTTVALLPRLMPLRFHIAGLRAFPARLTATAALTPLVEFF